MSESIAVVQWSVHDVPRQLLVNSSQILSAATVNGIVTAVEPVNVPRSCRPLLYICAVCPVGIFSPIVYTLTHCWCVDLAAKGGAPAWHLCQHVSMGWSCGIPAPAPVHLLNLPKSIAVAAQQASSTAWAYL